MPDRIYIVLLVITSLFAACSETLDSYSSVEVFNPVPLEPDTSIVDPTTPPDSGNADTTVTNPAGQIFITDRRGEKWNITHAVENYGFIASRFQHGLGKDKIRPINDPDFLFPGDDGYPSSGSSFQVIGTVINQAARSYDLGDLFFHEIVNDTFGDTHVTIGF